MGGAASKLADQISFGNINIFFVDMNYLHFSLNEKMSKSFEHCISEVRQVILSGAKQKCTAFLISVIKDA